MSLSPVYKDVECHQVRFHDQLLNTMDMVQATTKAFGNMDTIFTACFPRLLFRELPNSVGIRRSLHVIGVIAGTLKQQVHVSGAKDPVISAKSMTKMIYAGQY